MKNFLLHHYSEDLKTDMYLKKINILLGSKLVESTVTISPYNFSIIKQTFYSEDNLFEVIYDDYIEIENQNIPTKIRFLNNGILSFNIEIKSISALRKNKYSL